MKTLDFNEMENVVGGITCAGVGEVLKYLWFANNDQWWVVADLFSRGLIQCEEV